MCISYSGFSVCVHAQAFQLCLTLCNFMGGSPPGSSVLGIFQARILKWVAISSSRGSSQTRNLQCLLHCRWLLYALSYIKSRSKILFADDIIIYLKTWSKVAQSCLTLCSPMYCRLPGSSILGIFQARVLEWVAIIWKTLNNTQQKANLKIRT